MIIDNGLATGSLSISGSLIQSNGNVVISGSLLVSGNTVNNLTASYAINANLLDGLDSTQYTFTSSFNSYTSSINATIADILIETASLNLLTASLLTYTASINTRTGSLATTGSNTFTGNQIVNGTITAQTLIVQTITSSVSNITGSTRFGSLAANTHQFTGSVSVLGTISGSSIAGSGANLISIPNAALSNSTISGIALGSNLATLTIGTGLSGTSYNGSGAVTIANTGVTSITAGTGISRDVSTGGVTITNTGVTSIVAGTNISISGGTGAVTITNGVTNNNQLTNGAGYITTSALTNYVTLDGTQTITGLKTINNNLLFADSGTTKRGIQGTCGTNDMWFVGGGATATNAGFLEISTGDDGQTVGSCEPIYARQYGPGDPLTGTLVRTAALLDASGNTSFPGTVSATFSGNLTGNVTGNATNISAYTINQSVGTANSPSFAAASLTGNLTVSSGNTSGGGIILADDGDIVDLNDGFCAMRFSSGVRIHAGNRTGAAVIKLGNGGDIIASADITAYGSPSDINLKENIKPLETALDKVLKLQGVTYDWKEGTDARSMTNIKEDIGFIAQQVQEVVPELVRQNNNGFLSLRDKGITALLVEAIKEQQIQIEELKTIINGLTK